MTLTKNYVCSHCQHKVDVLYFDKIRKEWECKNCSTYLNDGDKQTKSTLQVKVPQNAKSSD